MSKLSSDTGETSRIIPKRTEMYYDVKTRSQWCTNHVKMIYVGLLTREDSNYSL